MPTVYVTQETELDYKDAYRFGEPEILFGRGVFPDELKDRVPKMVDILGRKMSGFVPIIDYILPVGDYFGVALVFYWLGKKGFNFAHVLKWDKLHNRYYSIRLEGISSQLSDRRSPNA